MSELEKIRILPLLPLKNSVLFPGLLMPLSVGRASSLAAVDAAVATEDKEIIVVAQRDASADTPAAADLFTIGTRAAIRKVARPKEDHIDILAFGLERVVIVKSKARLSKLQMRWKSGFYKVQPMDLILCRLTCRVDLRILSI